MSWNKPSSKPQPPPKKSAPSIRRGLLAGLAFIVLGAAALWFLSSQPQTSNAKPQASKGRIKEVKPAAVKPAVESKRARIAKPRTIEEALANVGEPEKPRIKVRAITPDELARLTNRVFTSGVDQLMSCIFTTVPGDLPMPIPSISDDEKANIVGILLSRDEVSASDSEAVAFRKEQVALAKKEMMQYLKEGGDPDDFLQYYTQELKNAFRYRNDVRDQVEEIIESGDLGLAHDFVTKMNEKLEAEGIRPFASGEFRELADAPKEASDGQ